MDTFKEFLSEKIKWKKVKNGWKINSRTKITEPEMNWQSDDGRFTIVKVADRRELNKRGKPTIKWSVRDEWLHDQSKRSLVSDEEYKRMLRWDHVNSKSEASLKKEVQSFVDRFPH